MRPLVVVADLSHTFSGIAAPTFPLGAGYIAAYLSTHLGTEIDVAIHKFPAETYEDVSNERCIAVLLSNYSWNEQIATALAKIAKEKSPKIVTVMGGPNFPTESIEKKQWLEDHPSIDFYVELEGEIPAFEIVKRLVGGSDLKHLRDELQEVSNLAYLRNGALIESSAKRLLQVSELASPYLTGTFDKFFEYPLIPMIETTRGCPFSCTFCADGLKIKNKVTRHETSVVSRELDYIADHKPKSPELIITDLNYGMYPQDEVTSEKIALMQKEINWPKTISASAGKNRSDRVMRNMEVLEGTWSAGASIQSTDPDVLLNVKRKNISSSAYLDIVGFGAKLSPDSKTHSEIILGLPGDTKLKHFESLRFVIDSGIDSVRMFQAILLPGTEMATEAARNTFQYRTAWRVIPGAFGLYQFGDKKVAIAETEEIIVGSNLISHSDYLDCRVMNLIVESFYNNGLFKEIFNLLSYFEFSKFDFLYHLYESLNSDDTSSADNFAQLREVINEFKNATSNSIFESKQSLLNEFEKALEISEQNFELGVNEILHFRALMMTNMREMVKLVISTIESLFKERNSKEVFYPEFYSDLSRYLVASKDVFGREGLKFSTETVEFYTDFPSLIGNLSHQVFNASNSSRQSQKSFIYNFSIPSENIEYIEKQESIYLKTALGMGRMLQRSNLNLFYRKPIRA